MHESPNQKKRAQTNTFKRLPSLDDFQGIPLDTDPKQHRISADNAGFVLTEKEGREKQEREEETALT